ncbi:stage II sporulation protein R [Desulfofalx alkaliphila]|uniref:stage II sporulation protein R n=1 Tax=Desulfofalx alkaliphila TaxID=105483 RepID=UPI0004E2384D|nr:stage II sporulation protein R [Desulfofalx alkaliphila]
MCNTKKAVLIIFLVMAMMTAVYNYNAQQDYARDLIRFHVIPNSDTIEDQMLKLTIRDIVIKEMKAKFEKVESKEEAILVTKENLSEIKKLAEEQIALAGKNYKVEVQLGDYQFPERTYGDIRLPQGKYQAVRLIIGEGKGQNWWCVLFPPLCFVDGVESLTEGRQAKGVKVFERDDIEFRLRSLEFLNGK